MVIGMFGYTVPEVLAFGFIIVLLAAALVLLIGGLLHEGRADVGSNPLRDRAARRETGAEGRGSVHPVSTVPPPHHRTAPIPASRAAREYRDPVIGVDQVSAGERRGLREVRVKIHPWGVEP